MSELLRNREVMNGVVDELDELYAPDADGTAAEVSFQALRSIPVLEAALKETLRLHPPLIILMRLVREDFELMGRTIPAGSLIAASPKVSNRHGQDFPYPAASDPARYIHPPPET